MTGVAGALPLPEDWHVLDLDPRSGPAGRAALVAALARDDPRLRGPAAARLVARHYDRLAAEQRSRGVAVSAFLAGRDATGLLAAALEVVVVPLPVVPAQTASGAVADDLAAALAGEPSALREVVRLDLPAGPAVGVRDVLAQPRLGEWGLVQVWLPVPQGSALVLTLTTPCVGELDGLTRLLVGVVRGLSVEGRAHGPIERHSRARSAAT